jgi:hypothetical protein
MTFVIIRTDAGRREFVSDPETNGTGGSFTPFVEKAKRFATFGRALAEACSNEQVVHIDNVLQKPEERT